MKITARLFHLFTLVLALVATSISTVCGQTFLTNAVVASYLFNGNANDGSGNGNNGTVSNVVFVADRFGSPASAASLAGNSTSFITINTTNLNLTPAFTVSAWVKFSSAVSGRILSTAGYELNINSGHAAMNVTELNNFGTNTQSVLPLPLGAWHHVVAIWNANSGTLYTDGVLASSYVTTLHPNYSRGFIPKIGRNSGSLSDSFSGLVDDIQIFKGALSAQEVATLYQYGAAPWVTLIKAVNPSFSNLSIGTNYQLQVSSDMTTWTNHGSPFTATNSLVVYPEYFDVADWSELFFRLQMSP